MWLLRTNKGNLYLTTCKPGRKNSRVDGTPYYSLDFSCSLKLECDDPVAEDLPPGEMVEVALVEKEEGEPPEWAIDHQKKAANDREEVTF